MSGAESDYQWLMDWDSPYLRQSSFACIVQKRSGVGEVTAEELDAVATLIPKHVDFEGTFFLGHEIVDFWPPEPDEDDFETAEAFDEAWAAWSPNTFEPKPWLRRELSGESLREYLAGAIRWSINNKLYPIELEDGSTTIVPFSHDPLEKKLVAEKEADHVNRVNDFIDRLVGMFEGGAQQLFETEHLLDCLNPPKENPADPFEGCFYDAVRVIVSDEHIVLLWIGHLRSYG
jgi:hypothetical protein